jgi:hypothetical protein
MSEPRQPTRSFPRDDNEYAHLSQEEMLQLRAQTMMEIQANRRQYEALVERLNKLDWALKR